MQDNIRERRIEKREQIHISPKEAIDLLMRGNRRFLSGNITEKKYHSLLASGAEGQSPYAAILGCIDSRVTPETLFDQTIGDIFVSRVAGNVVSQDIVASLEYACGVIGSKAIMILGHTSCGAVTGACEYKKSRKNISEPTMSTNVINLFQKIVPAIDDVECQETADLDNAIATKIYAAPYNDIVISNIRRQIVALRESSSLLARLEADGEIAIVGAVYDAKSGEAVLL